MQKETGIKFALIGAAACAAVYALSATTTEASTSLFAPMDPVEQDFMQFVAKYRRNYGTKEEYNFRLQQFRQTATKIGHFQAQNAESTSTVGVNQFSDWTPEEFKKILGFKPDADADVEYLEYVAPEGLTASNGGIDWRQRGVVTGVKDQGQCGSCWAFSSTGALEGHHAVARGQLVSLSEQQLVDCNLENGGCNGGWMDQAFSYSAGNPLQDEGSYPYQAARIGCRYNRSRGVVGATQIWKINNGDNNSLRSAVQTRGPVSVAIQADQAVFQQYRGGIINSNDCGTNMDHAVLVVGFGDGYWIVKNSWTAGWGEGGYVRIADVGGAGICGINQHAVFPDTN